MPSEAEYVCPVCGYDGLKDAPRDRHGDPSFDICPCCRTQFGYDDARRTHLSLREDWIARGMSWWSTSPPPPPDWDPWMQLRRVGSGNQTDR